jgi:hypothetical protein
VTDPSSSSTAPTPADALDPERDECVRDQGEVRDLVADVASNLTADRLDEEELTARLEVGLRGNATPVPDERLHMEASALVRQALDRQPAEAVAKLIAETTAAGGQYPSDFRDRLKLLHAKDGAGVERAPRCPRCDGRGYLDPEPDAPRDEPVRTCPDCQGVGRATTPAD